MHHSRHPLNCNLRLLFYVAGVCCLWRNSIVATTPSLSHPTFADGACLNGSLCVSDSEVIACAGSSFPSVEQQQVTISLVICDWIDETIDPRNLSSLAGLRNLAIHAAANDTDIDRQFSHVFPPGLSLEVLNISRLGLVSLTPIGLLDALTSTLRILDVSHNRINTLSPASLNSLTVLDVARFIGNPWSCGVELTWLVDTPLVTRLVDMSNWTCGPIKYTGKPVLPVIKMIKVLRQQCPSRTPYNCSCELSNVVWNAGGKWPASNNLHSENNKQLQDSGELVSVTVVNCSSRGLYGMPPYLPASTTTLLLSRNMISDVRPLTNNPHYRHVSDVFLDNNKVRSIAALEGSEWLSSFRVLSLRGNQLNQLPTYALDHAFQKNRNLAQLYLGNNQWSCDCMFTPGFQDLLAKYQSVIRDIADIRCAKQKNDENSQQPIRELSRSLLCQEHHGSSLTVLDVLNVALALLIVLVLGKLAYDYWAFKTSGRLPWLVAKMP